MIRKSLLTVFLLASSSAMAAPAVFEKSGRLSGPVCPDGYNGKVTVKVTEQGEVTAILDGGNDCLSDTIEARAEVRLIAADGRELMHIELATDVPGRGWPWNGQVRRGDRRVLQLPDKTTVAKVELGLRNNSSKAGLLEVFKTALMFGAVATNR